MRYISEVGGLKVYHATAMVGIGGHHSHIVTILAGKHEEADTLAYEYYTENYPFTHHCVVISMVSAVGKNL